MDFLKLAEQRASCRKYMNTPVKRELIDQCLEAARIAPSACNCQPWRYIAVDNPQVVAKLAPLLRMEGSPINGFTDGVPVFAVVAEKPVDLTDKLGAACLRTNYSEIDIGLSVAHFCLSATALGLGTCVLGIFREAAVKELLGIPDDYIIRVVIALGHPAPSESRPKKRLEREQMSGYNAFSSIAK